MLQLRNTHRWFFTMKGLTFACLFFLLIFSVSALDRIGSLRHGHGAATGACAASYRMNVKSKNNIK